MIGYVRGFLALENLTGNILLPENILHFGRAFVSVNFTAPVLVEAGNERTRIGERRRCSDEDLSVGIIDGRKRSRDLAKPISLLESDEVSHYNRASVFFEALAIPFSNQVTLDSSCDNDGCFTHFMHH